MFKFQDNRLNQEENDKFNEYFNKEETNKIIKRLEEERYIRLGIIFLGIILTIGMFYLLYITPNSGNNIILIGWFFILSILGGTFMVKGKTINKSYLIGGLMKEFYGESFNYFHGKGRFSESPESIYVNTGFLNSFDEVETIEDTISYDYKLNGNDSIHVEGGEIKTIKIREYRDSKGNRHQTKTKVDHVYMFKIKFLNSRFFIKEKIHITKDFDYNYTSKVISFLLINGLIIGFTYFLLTNLLIILFISTLSISLSLYYLSYYKKGNKIDLENIEFERLYDVHCNNDILSRQILTLPIMESITNFTKETGKNYEFLFIEDCVYMKYNVDSSYLEFSLLKSYWNNIKQYVDFYLEIKNLIEFVNKVNLIYFDKEYFNRR